MVEDGAKLDVLRWVGPSEAQRPFLAPWNEMRMLEVRGAGGMGKSRAASVIRASVLAFAGGSFGSEHSLQPQYRIKTTGRKTKKALELNNMLMVPSSILLFPPTFPPHPMEDVPAPDTVQTDGFHSIDDSISIVKVDRMLGKFG